MVMVILILKGLDLWICVAWGRPCSYRARTVPTYTGSTSYNYYERFGTNPLNFVKNDTKLSIKFKLNMNNPIRSQFFSFKLQTLKLGAVRVGHGSTTCATRAMRPTEHITIGNFKFKLA